MAISHTEVLTESASKYLQQLCKHWSHKLTVEFDPEKGRVEFPSGDRLDMAADAKGLSLQLHAGAENIDRMETVVADHLKRFAFREELVFNWTRKD
jgi:uncharacterized protein